MRHYEIVFLVHPDQSDQTQSILSKFSSIVKDSRGVVHRSENIGNKRLSYPIQDQFKASFGLMNIECNQEVIKEIKDSFRFNDSIIRDLISVTKKAHTDVSALSSQADEEAELETGFDSQRPSSPKKDLKEQDRSDGEKKVAKEPTESSDKEVDEEAENLNSSEKEEK